MSATESAPLMTLDVAFVSQVVRALLNEAGRQILVEDGPRQDLGSMSIGGEAADPTPPVGPRTRLGPGGYPISAARGLISCRQRHGCAGGHCR